MTKMTLLHFASPFAVSLPVPPADRGHEIASEPVASAHGTFMSAAPLFDSRSATAEGASSMGPESAGFEASLYATVLRRYGQQSGAGSGATPRVEADGTPA